MVGWVFWLLVGYVMLIALGFGAKHEILAIAGLFVLLPTLLLAARALVWRPVRLKTLLAVAVVSGAFYGLVVSATVAEWVGVEAQM